MLLVVVDNILFAWGIFYVGLIDMCWRIEIADSIKCSLKSGAFSIGGIRIFTVMPRFFFVKTVNSENKMNRNQDGAMSDAVHVVSNDEIDLRELWLVFWRGRWLICFFSLVAAISSALVSLQLPNFYVSESLLVPASGNQSDQSRLLSSFGSLAGLAGIAVGRNGLDKTTLALEVVRSREFLARFARTHNLVVPLIASDGWNFEQNEWVINANIYDSVSGEWVRESNSLGRREPSDFELAEALRGILIVSKEKKSGVVRIGFEMVSPVAAKKWANWIVEDLNEQARQRDIDDASRSIEYLREQLNNTSVTEMRQVFYRLITEQMKTITFAKGREDYIFKVIDPAVLAEKKSKPKRLFIVLVSTMVGWGIGVLLVLIFYSKKEG